ncbi:hypothetical protein ACQKWADRAFT_289725 [Trichoderma austrokoningii]
MASNTMNPNDRILFSLGPNSDRYMRAGYVIVSEERASGSEYSGSTCCCCSSCCDSSCSCDEYSDDDDDDEEEGDESEWDDDEIVIEEEEVVEEEGYWSDCSACWARRDLERRGRTGRRFGRRYMGIARGRDVSGFGMLLLFLLHFPMMAERKPANVDSITQSLQHHHHHSQCEQTPQREGQSANRVTFRSTSTIINDNDNNGQSTAETPSFRGLLDRIVSTTRQLRQGEQNARRLRSLMRVLEDVQRGQRANDAVSNNTTSPTAAGQTRARPRRAAGRSCFMSGGRNTSVNRRRTRR